MDWIHTFTIIGVLGAFVMYVSGRTDKRIDALENKIESTKKDINQIALNVSNIEGQITQMTRPNVIPIQKPSANDEPKEN